jgi:hypothetical protein
MRFLRFMLEGGWSMWFVLAFGLLSVAAAAAFARRPRVTGERLVLDLSRATTFAVLSAVSLNLATVGARVPNVPEWANSPRVHLIVMEGISESLAPAILGFALLAFASIILAVGQRRLSRSQRELDR